MTRPGIRGLPPRLTGVRRCLVMGVLNVTPDSFSDGGRYLDSTAAIGHGLEMLRAGADLVDVGGESTRPGAQPVPPREEQRRVLPVVRGLVAAGAVVSIDTMHAETAAAALEAGAAIVNDVSGGLADPAILDVVKAAEVPYVLMHWRGPGREMQARATYADVVAEVRHELAARLAQVTAAGVDAEQVVLDPGLGFAKQAEHNWALLAHLDALRALGRPLLVGASRKSFLGALLAGPDGTPAPPPRREAATTALSALVAAGGAWCVRVHDVAASRDAVRVSAALAAAGGQPG